MNQITSSENKGFGPTSQHPPPPPSQPHVTFHRPPGASASATARPQSERHQPNLGGGGHKTKGRVVTVHISTVPPSVPDQHTTKGKEEEAT